MLRIVPVLLGILLLMAVTSYASAGDSSPTPGPSEAVLTVRVIHDLNENGVRDEGEPGLEGWEAGGLYFCSDVVAWKGTTDSSGAFSVAQPAPGHDCVFFEVEFGWFGHLTSYVDVRYEPGDKVEVVLLARKVGQDVALYSGRLILDGLPAAPDVEVEAWVGEERCGEAQLDSRRGITHYDLYVLGVDERPGCATDGGDVVVTVSGVGAGSLAFNSGGRRSLDLIAGPTPMYFWIDANDTPGLWRPGIPKIGDTVCGESFSVDLGSPAWDMREIYVRADASVGGCGRAGAVVSLWSQDRIVTQVMWDPGRGNKDSLRHFGDADCDGAVDSIDAAVVLQFAANLLEDLSSEGAADVDHSGRVDAVDSALLLQRNAGIIRWFAPE